MILTLKTEYEISCNKYTEILSILQTAYTMTRIQPTDKDPDEEGGFDVGGGPDFGHAYLLVNSMS